MAQMGSGLQVERNVVTLQVQGPEDVPALAAAVVRAGGKSSIPWSPGAAPWRTSS